MGWAPLLPATRPRPLRDAAPEPIELRKPVVSARVPHSPQEGHRPIHLDTWCSQELHVNTVCREFLDEVFAEGMRS